MYERTYVYDVVQSRIEFKFKFKIQDAYDGIEIIITNRPQLCTIRALRCQGVAEFVTALIACTGRAVEAPTSGTTADGSAASLNTASV